MNRDSHLLMGGIFAAAAIVFGGVSLENIPLAAMSFFGSIFPDYDVAYGTHRKTLHNIWVMFLVGGYFWYYGFSALGSIFFMLGFLSHLFADAFTIKGITPFYPLLSLKISGPITTGSKMEKVVMAVITILFVMAIVIITGGVSKLSWLKSILSCYV